ncbi:DUF934 domain-containing protein [Duganella sp. BJB488]|uniref:DUF934 domain-containing protein n=1 Tax=unclassified Duganella TaxID=2636909 RepID=UPI000E3406EA|nr:MULTISPECIES: DUF934 domain-containing protein [unclassified Duganella]NVD74017.1 DUF934 domain-containing protein [Duganella sp. BJB1802]RFP12314.1 DUF934 domain-containing protein [Duganella sp. BJB489]RFP16592.1 DUF934 domain-containing protein [Duganella sp. BJB488]RFP30678.1 DUF934 domain-containing protein [Duganella sp. BJB480]
MSEAVKNLIIKGHEIVEDDWLVLRLAEPVDGAPKHDPATVAVPAGKFIVPLSLWLVQRELLAARAAAGEIGVWIASDERPEALKDDLSKVALIAVDFPKFTDGRGYSIAYNLRTRLGWTGELRAIGDVLRDQLFSMRRVGFNAYATRPDRSIHEALKGLSDFSETYQASVDQKVPLFRRHARNVGVGANNDGFGI